MVILINDFRGYPGKLVRCRPGRQFERQVGKEEVSLKEFVAKNADAQRGWQDFSVEKCVAEEGDGGSSCRQDLNEEIDFEKMVGGREEIACREEIAEQDFGVKKCVAEESGSGGSCKQDLACRKITCREEITLEEKDSLKEEGITFEEEVILEEEIAFEEEILRKRRIARKKRIIRQGVRR